MYTESTEEEEINEENGSCERGRESEKAFDAAVPCMVVMKF